MLEKKCKHCLNIFKTYPSQNKKFCNKNCAYEYKKYKSWQKYKKICAVCDVEFLPPRQAEGGTYCSYKCRGKADTKDRIDRNGYWYVYKPENPMASKQGYVAEHRLIAAKKYGRILKRNEEVHHIDHNKKNNDPDNLVIMDKALHSSYHMTENHKNKKIWTEEFRKKHHKNMIKNNRGKRWRD